MELGTIENRAKHELQVCESISAIYSYEQHSYNLLPLYLSRVSAGFPSPADDHIEANLDLNEHIVRHPSATFFSRVSGNSMIDAGIFHNDLLVIDKAETARDGSVVVAFVDGEMTVKRFKKIKGKTFLAAENPDYQPIEIKEDMEFQIWGVVIAVIRRP